jgi:hypothetical protein
MGIAAEILPWSSVVGQSVLLKDSETGWAVAQLGIRIHTDAAGEQDIKSCAGHVAKHVQDAFAAVARVEELEVAIRAALSYIQNQPVSHGNGHAEMVIAALRGALRTSAARDS